MPTIDMLSGNYRITASRATAPNNNAPRFTISDVYQAISNNVGKADKQPITFRMCLESETCDVKEWQFTFTPNPPPTAEGVWFHETDFANVLFTKGPDDQMDGWLSEQCRKLFHNKDELIDTDMLIALMQDNEKEEMRSAIVSIRVGLLGRFDPIKFSAMILSTAHSIVAARHSAYLLELLDEATQEQKRDQPKPTKPTKRQCTGLMT